jgi:hypothetical protein
MTPITKEQLRAFLASEGWDLGDTDELGESWVLPGNAEAPAILVPENIEGPSYHDLLDTAVSRLQWVTGLPEPELAGRIVATLFDTLEVRVIDSTTAGGLIPLERGVQLAQSLRTVILNGARLQFAGGRAAHRGGLSGAAKEVLARLEMAPPSAGSFRYTVQAPVDQQLALDREDVGATDVHQTLVSALRALDAARETTEAPIPTDAEELDDAVSRGVSTNLVKAVRELDTQSPALSVEFRAYWSRPEPDVPERVVLGPQNFSQLLRLEGVLSHFDPQPNFSLRGWIKEVGAEALAIGVDAQLAGTVVVETRIDGRQRDVRVEVAGDRLKQAGAAVGQQYLSAEGTLERIGRSWFLTGALNIHLSTPPPQPEGGQ